MNTATSISLHQPARRVYSANQRGVHPANREEAQSYGVQLGYEARCAKPHAFDVMLGSQLGVGAYRALVEKRLNGVMVSVSGQLQLEYVPFETLVDPETLVTVVRDIEPDSDFQKLTRFLETYVNEGDRGVPS